MSVKNILIISAHPDDHIHTAGTIMYLQDRGYRVYEALITNGENGAYHRFNSYSKRSGIHQLRLEEYRKAAEFLNIKHTYFLGEEDGLV